MGPNVPYYQLYFQPLKLNEIFFFVMGATNLLLLSEPLLIREVLLQCTSTVEPLNKGHNGTSHFIHYKEVGLFFTGGSRYA